MKQRMDWQTALTHAVPGVSPEERAKRILLAGIPRFEAPTDARAWRRRIPQLRRRALADLFLRGYSRDIVHAKPRVVWGAVLKPDPAYVVRKLRYECYPNYWIPALLYEPARMSGKVPAVLNPNGHHAGGKACDYKQIRCANLARRGMIALSPEFIGMGELQADRAHNDQALLSLTGMAGVGLFYLAMSKGLDVLLSRPHSDGSRVCMTGLSGGGWQTIVLSAMDPRITVCVPVAGYTSTRNRVLFYGDRGDLEQLPPDLTTVVDYQEMTAMLAPRPALLILNEKDTCCFLTGRTRPVIFDAVKPTYEAFNASACFETHNNRNPGTHNYEADNRSALYRFLNKNFDLQTPPHDIHRDNDILTEQELEVGLPDDQATMRTLALGRARVLARARQAPRTAAQRRALRKRIARVIRMPDDRARTRRIGGRAGEGGAALYDLRLGPWSAPVVVNGPACGGPLTIHMLDGGRAAAAAVAPDDDTTLVAEIMGTGEHLLGSSLGILVEAAGHRLLGVQVAQILACAEFAVRFTDSRATLRGDGLLSGFAALLAAALRPELFGRLSVSWEVMRLHYLFQWPTTYESVQPLCCFGLLEVADVPEILTLLEDVVFDPYGRVVKADAIRAARSGTVR